MVKIELVYIAQDGSIFHKKMNLNHGATVSDALIQSEIFKVHPETKNLPVGLYAKQITLDTVLKE